MPVFPLIGLLALALSSCASLIAKKNTYGGGGNAAEVGGAKVRMGLKPEGTSGGSYVLSAMVVSAGVATLDGPFRWRVEAEGERGRHEGLIVHRVRTRTSTSGRDEWYPPAHLGRRAPFGRRPGETGWSAVYEIPGQLRVKPSEDGALDVWVDLTVVEAARRTRKVVKFHLSPEEKRQDEFIFIPAEIVENIGKGPDEWADEGWD